MQVFEGNTRFGLGPEKCLRWNKRKRNEWLPENKFLALQCLSRSLRANTDAIGAVAAGIAANRACVLYRWLLVGALWARALAASASE